MPLGTSLRILSTSLQKVVGPLQSPNGILKNSKDPNGVEKAVFCRSCFLRGMQWKAAERSRQEKMSLPASLPAI